MFSFFSSNYAIGFSKTLFSLNMNLLFTKLTASCLVSSPLFTHLMILALCCFCALSIQVWLLGANINDDTVKNTNPIAITFSFSLRIIVFYGFDIRFEKEFNPFLSTCFQ